MSTLAEIDREKEVTYEDLKLFTDNFSEERRICRTQFGMLYRGKIPGGWRGGNHGDRDVTVKMWDTEMHWLETQTSVSVFHSLDPEYLLERMKDEIRFMSLPLFTSHKIVPKVEGYCFEENKLGVVYDVKPLDAVHNIINDEDKFGWVNRVKVALGLARFLKLCHGNALGFLVRNLSAAHVIVDEHFDPVLVDFAMIIGGGLGNDSLPGRGLPEGSCYYVDPNVLLTGFWSWRSDVYSFGAILLELIIKCTSRELANYRGKKHEYYTVAYRALAFYEREYKDNEAKCSFVDVFLRLDADYREHDGVGLTMLALRCVEDPGRKRPNMEEVVSHLEKLEVVTMHGGML